MRPLCQITLTTCYYLAWILKLRFQSRSNNPFYRKLTCPILVSHHATLFVAKYCDDYVCLSVCLCVCFSVREDISETTAISTKLFMHVAHVRGSVLLRHVDDRPHRLPAGRGDEGACLFLCPRAKCSLRSPCFTCALLRQSFCWSSFV